jgi:hypothetical protein
MVVRICHSVCLFLLHHPFEVFFKERFSPEMVGEQSYEEAKENRGERDKNCEYLFVHELISRTSLLVFRKSD